LPENSCNAKAKFDALSTPDVKNVVEVLRKAENANTPATPGRHDVWLTEFWWETSPPDKCTSAQGAGGRPSRRARSSTTARRSRRSMP